MHDPCVLCNRDYDAVKYNCPYDGDCDGVHRRREEYEELEAEVRMEDDFLARCDGE